MLILILLLLAALAPCPAGGRSWKRRELLFLTSYNGGYKDHGYLASFMLQQSKKHDKWRSDPINWDITCGKSPSSIFLDERRDMIYCIDEGLGAPNGSITVYNLTYVGGELPTSRYKITGRFRPAGNRVLTPPGLVSATTYGFDKRDIKRAWHKDLYKKGTWMNFKQFLTDLIAVDEDRKPWNLSLDPLSHKAYYLAVANYAGSALSGWRAPEGYGHLEGVTTWTQDTSSYDYRLDKPGQNPQRQDAPHPHQTLLDPTAEFLLVPDLGADMVRIYQSSRRSKEGGYLDPQPPLLLPAGCGPRHGAFVTHKYKVPKKERKKDMVYQETKTYFHLVCELSNSVVSYKVEYTKRLDMNAWYPTYSDDKGNQNLAKSIEFTKLGEQNTFGGARVPDGAAAAEIVVSPDNRFVMVSNRNDLSFPDFRTPGPSFPNETQTKVESDSLATFSVAGDGSLKFEELSPAGGSFPRSFAVNKKGDIVAVALQYSKSLAIFSRNVQTGRMGPQLTRYNDLGNLSSVTFSTFPVIDPQTKVPGGNDEAKQCLIEIDRTDPGLCQKNVFPYWPDDFEWPASEDWRKLQEYPAPGTNVISRFPVVVYPKDDRVVLPFFEDVVWP